MWASTKGASAMRFGVQRIALPARFAHEFEDLRGERRVHGVLALLMDLPVRRIALPRQRRLRRCEYDETPIVVTVVGVAPLDEAVDLLRQLAHPPHHVLVHGQQLL